MGMKNSVLNKKKQKRSLFEWENLDFYTIIGIDLKIKNCWEHQR